MLNNLFVVLVKPRFPENIGMAVRACINMGVTELVVVDPERWNMDKILPLATPKGAEMAQSIRVVDTFAEAIKDAHYVYGTTARTGGWRRSILSPEKSAPLITGQLREGNRVALVFGPEDRGLLNEETEVCSQLITIPTNPDATSLNLAQAVLIICYECFKLAGNIPFRPAGNSADSRKCTHEEQETFIATLQQTLLDIDYLRRDNPDYFMLPVRRFLQKIALRRHEFSMLMGICKQVQGLVKRNK